MVNAPVMHERRKLEQIAQSIVQEVAKNTIWSGVAWGRTSYSTYPDSTRGGAIPIGDAVKKYLDTWQATMKKDIEIVEPGVVAARSDLYDVDEAALRSAVNKILGELAEIFQSNPLFEICDHSEDAYGVSIRQWKQEHLGIPYHVECTHYHQSDQEYAGSLFNAPSQLHRTWHEVEDRFTYLNITQLQIEGLWHPFMNWEDPNDMAILWPNDPVCV